MGGTWRWCGYAELLWTRARRRRTQLNSCASTFTWSPGEKGLDAAGVVWTLGRSRCVRLRKQKKRARSMIDSTMAPAPGAHNCTMLVVHGRQSAVMNTLWLTRIVARNDLLRRTVDVTSRHHRQVLRVTCCRWYLTVYLCMMNYVAGFLILSFSCMNCGSEIVSFFVRFGVHQACMKSPLGGTYVLVRFDLAS